MAKPTMFPLANGTLGGGPAMVYGTKEAVMDLPICRPNSGGIVSCWRLSWRERLAALLFGRVWLHVWAQKTHAPVSVTATREYLTAREETK